MDPMQVAGAPAVLDFGAVRFGQPGNFGEACRGGYRVKLN